MEDQFDMLAQNPDCLVATPGRLQHILAESQVLGLGLGVGVGVVVGVGLGLGVG